MKKTLFFLMIIIFSNISSNSQNLKFYKGHFETKSTQGIASYSYFENQDYERIYNGNFTFYTSNNLLKITGTFKNDKKNGYWHYTAKNFSVPYAYHNMGVKDISFNIGGNYINGNMEGTWSLKRVVNTWGFNKSKIVEESSIVNFKDNNLVGNFSFSYKYGSEISVNVIGQFDTKSKKSGTWNIYYVNNGIKYQGINKYTNDTLYSRIVRNLSNGDIIYKSEYTEVYEKTYVNGISEIKVGTDVNMPIMFWISNNGYHGYIDILLYSFSDSLSSTNPIYDMPKGINIDNYGDLISPN